MTQHYSQGDEQQHIASFFAREPAKHRRFLDVGAYDGVTFSNTRSLAEAGWTGVLVEASPTCQAPLIRLYGGDDRFTLVCVPLVASVSRRLINFYDCGDAVGTTNEAHRELWKDRAPFKPILVAGVTWDDLLLAIPSHDFDLVSIDVEGETLSVLRSCPLLSRDSAHRPSLVVVEHHPEGAIAFDSAMGEFGYDLFARTHENTLYRNSQ